MIVSDPRGEIRKRNLILINEQMPYMSEGVLLLEVNPFLAPWVDFATNMKNRLKLFSRSLILFARVWLGPLQSGEDYDKMFTNYYSESEAIKKDIKAMEDKMKKYTPEEFSLLMYANPGFVIGGVLAKEMALFPLDILSGETNSMTKELGRNLGLYHLPLVGGLFKDPPAECMFIGPSARENPDAADEYWRCMMIEQEKTTRKDKNGFITLFNNIQRLFLLDFIPEGRVVPMNANVEQRQIILEGESDKKPEWDATVMTNSLLKVLEEAGVFTEMESVGEQLLEAKQKLMDQVLDPILSRVETGSALAAASNFEEFAEVIKSKTSEFPDLAKLDLNSFSQTLDQTIEETKNDPKQWAEMVTLAREQIGGQKPPQGNQVSEGDESSENLPEGLSPEEEQTILQHSRVMLFQQSKQDFQEEIISATEDSYEEARKMITEGMDENTMAKLAETDVGKKHLALIQESMEKLEQAFTKLKQMK